MDQNDHAGSIIWNPRCDFNKNFSYLVIVPYNKCMCNALRSAFKRSEYICVNKNGALNEDCHFIDPTNLRVAFVHMDLRLMHSFGALIWKRVLFPLNHFFMEFSKIWDYIVMEATLTLLKRLHFVLSYQKTRKASSAFWCFSNLPLETAEAPKGY
jgi:hypothetical protein